MRNSLRIISVLVIAAALSAGSGCSSHFTSQVRQAGLYYELVPSPPGSPRNGAGGAPEGYELQARRTAGGRAAQVLLPLAWAADVVVSVGEVAGMVTTVAGWQRVVP